jgi:hypothetical protein
LQALTEVADILTDVAADTLRAQTQARIELALSLLEDLMDECAASVRYWEQVPMAPFPPENGPSVP